MRTCRQVLALVVLVVAGSIGTGSGTASAAYGDCPIEFNCFFSGAGGSGAKWQFAGNNPDLSGYGIATQSGYNRGTSGMRACGYRVVGYNDLNYSRAMNRTATYSARPIRSMQWYWYDCPNG